MKPYGLCADIHFHAWNKFAGTNPNGVNTRLEILLLELERVARETEAAGGDRVIIAGDLFHVRGSVAPSVLNPVREELRGLAIEHNLVFEILAGNHDMEFKQSSEIGNAIQAVACESYVNVHHKPAALLEGVVMIPWIEDQEELRATILREAHPDMDLILHAPINGVLMGIPDTGIDPAWLATVQARRIFSGHYHNHKELVPGKVWSIGALAHHTWSDVGSYAGFMIVGDDVRYYKSHAPEFIDIYGDDDPTEVELRVPGHYVRAKTGRSKTAEINELREWLEKSGAKGVLIQHVPQAAVERAKGGEIGKSSTLEESVSKFVVETFAEYPDHRADAIGNECQRILAQANAV